MEKFQILGVEDRKGMREALEQNAKRYFRLVRETGLELTLYEHPNQLVDRLKIERNLNTGEPFGLILDIGMEKAAGSKCTTIELDKAQRAYAKETSNNLLDNCLMAVVWSGLDQSMIYSDEFIMRLAGGMLHQPEVSPAIIIAPKIADPIQDAYNALGPHRLALMIYNESERDISKARRSLSELVAKTKRDLYSASSLFNLEEVKHYLPEMRK